MYAVSPKQGTIEPKSRLELNVSVYLNDNVRFNDQLTVLVKDSTHHTGTNLLIQGGGGGGVGLMIVTQVWSRFHQTIGSEILICFFQ